MAIKLDSITKYFGICLFLLMLILPRTHQVIKIPLVLIIFLITIITVIRYKSVIIHKSIFYWFVAYFFYSSIWIFIGVFNNNPGVYDYVKMNICWGLLYLILILALKKIESILLITKVIIYAGIIISCIDFLHVLAAFEVICFPVFLSAVGIHEGYVHITIHNITTLTFVTPFLLALVIMSDRSEYKVYKIKKKLLIVAVMSTIVISILSGRRALWVNIIITSLLLIPLFLIISKNKYKKIILRLSKVSIFILFIILSGLIFFKTKYNMNLLEGLSERFTSAFTSEIERSDQFMALTEGFLNGNLLVGDGFGVGVKDVVRNSDSPWVYELSYNLLLFNTGVLGVLFYFFLLTFIYYLCFRIVKQNSIYSVLLISYMIGMTNFLIGNATNPNFYTFDFMWILFLPIALINRILLIGDSVNDI